MKGFIAPFVLVSVCLIQGGHTVPLCKTVETGDAPEDAAMAPIIDTIIPPNKTITLDAKVGASHPVKITAEVAADAPPVRVLILPCATCKKFREKRDGAWRKACSSSSRTSMHCFLYE